MNREVCTYIRILKHWRGSSVNLIVFFLGGVGVLWFIMWTMLTHDRPANHPRISIKEREYIQSSIGAGQDKERRVRELCCNFKLY